MAYSQEELQERKELLDSIKTQTDAALETRATKKEFENFSKQFEGLEIEALRTIADPEKGVMSVLKTMGTELNALKSQLDAPKEDDMSIRGQIIAWQKENKGAFDLIAQKQRPTLTPLNIRLNSPMTPSNTYNSSTRLTKTTLDSTPNEIVRVAPQFWDYIKKGRTNSEYYVWVNKKNATGAAGFIGPGVAKPGISFELETEASNAKKIAASEKCALELLKDVEGMKTWLEDELYYQVMIKANSTLMSGTLSSTVPAGIQTLSTTFSLTTVLTQNPNNWDAIRACVAQLRSGNLRGVVTTFMNPIDYANMVMSKALSQGQPFMPGETGSIIVEDNNVAVGYIQVALLDYYKILVYEDFNITYGWENDDFTKNLITALGEMRIHQMFSQNNTGAFIYDSLANIKTAITAQAMA